MIQYPEGLPLPQLDGYGFSPTSAVVKTQMRSGRVRMRRQYASVPTWAPVRWQFTPTQAQLFEAWYEEVLVSGTQWFEMPLQTPQGLANYRARFSDIYQGPDLVGADSWRFSATLELFERPLAPPGWATIAPEFILHMDKVDIAANKSWPAED